MSVSDSRPPNPDVVYLTPLCHMSSRVFLLLWVFKVLPHLVEGTNINKIIKKFFANISPFCQTEKI